MMGNEKRAQAAELVERSVYFALPWGDRPNERARS